MALDAVVWASIHWQASNAAFNLAVLGATCRTYEWNMYGARTDTLNAGLATDRLLAEWPTAAEPIAGRTEPYSDGVDPDPHHGRARFGLSAKSNTSAQSTRAEHVHINIPGRIAELKAYGSSSAAREWQNALRETFQARSRPASWRLASVAPRQTNLVICWSAPHESHALRSVELYMTRLPLVRPFTTSSHTKDHLEHILIRVRDQEGGRRLGRVRQPVRSVLLSETNETSWHILRDFPDSRPARSAFRGRQPGGGDLVEGTRQQFRQGRLEMACWDLLTRVTHTPLAQALAALAPRSTPA